MLSPSAARLNTSLVHLRAALLCATTAACTRELRHQLSGYHFLALVSCSQRLLSEFHTEILYRRDSLMPKTFPLPDSHPVDRDAYIVKRDSIERKCYPLHALEARPDASAHRTSPYPGTPWRGCLRPLREYGQTSR